MEGTHPVGRQPFMPDSTLSRRSVALHARLAKYPSGNHKIIPRIDYFAAETFLVIQSRLSLFRSRYRLAPVGIFNRGDQTLGYTRPQ